jgi:glycosyltransferase involved in cell wall biosynthesis
LRSDPLVSIVTPLYNQLRYIETTIESVLSQTYGRIEYIVVNDGSNDGSRECLEKYRGKITIIDQENMGQAQALNRGWSLSRGKYIGYLSSDDILAPRCVETLVSELEANPDLVCAYPNSDLISPDSNILKHGVCRPFDLEKLVIEQECYIGPGALWRNAAHQRVGGWRPDLKLAPDREYWIRLADEGAFHFEDQSLAGYRLHPESLSSKVTSEQVSLEYVRVLDEYFKKKSIPDSIAWRKSEAYGCAYWLIARNMLRQGSIRLFLRYFRLASVTDPASVNIKNLIILARSSVGKPLRLFAGNARNLFGVR